MLSIFSKTAILFCVTVIFSVTAMATWSIIVVDEKAKQIGIAGASCTNSVYGIGAIVPGKGAVVVQAMSNPLPRMKAVQMIRNGALAKNILEAMKHPDFDPEEQQYGLICMNNIADVQSYTGKDANPFNGAVSAKGISVQGNTLASNDLLQAVLDAAIKARDEGKSLEEILLIALEAGAAKGGDKRCGDLKASSAFITVAKSTDDPRKPFFNLVVNRGRKNHNAVAELRKRFPTTSSH